MTGRHSFNFPAPIRFGCGVIDELPAYLAKHGLSRPLLVTDAIVSALPFFEEIIDRLKQAGSDVEIYSHMHKNPVASDVLAGAAHFNTTQCDSIVGIGGGVPLDVARAIALAAHHPAPLFKYDDLLGGDQYVTEKIPHFITVPTTSGTGSEVGRSAIIAEDDTKKKRILFSPRLLAQQVFADPELTADMPSFVTAATGMDALTHNMEAYLAKNYHPMCDGIALEGMKLIIGAIEKATLEPTIEARADMLLGSIMGGVAFQKGLGVVHSLAHPLSAQFDTHHGLANALNLSVGMRFNYLGQEERFEQMARVLGVKSGQFIPDFIAQLNQNLGLPRSLGAIGVMEDDIPMLAQLALEDFCHPNNPKPVNLQDFEQLYYEAL